MVSYRNEGGAVVVILRYLASLASTRGKGKHDAMPRL